MHSMSSVFGYARRCWILFDTIRMVYSSGK